MNFVHSLFSKIPCPPSTKESLTHGYIEHKHVYMHTQMSLEIETFDALCCPLFVHQTGHFTASQWSGKFTQIVDAV